MDCHAGLAPARNDSKTESALHTSLESPADFEAPAERHALSAVKSSFSSKPCSEQALEASSEWGQKNDSKGEGASLLAVAKPQIHTCTFKPLHLNKKENTESKEALESQKVKAKDFEKLDSESTLSVIASEHKRAWQSIKTDSKKRGLESKNLESTIDSKSENKAESAGTLDTEKLDSDSKKLDLESKRHLAKLASLICPGLTALQCVAKIGEANLRDASVLVVGANSSVGRIVSFLCEEAGALVFRVSSTQAKRNLAESHNEHLESTSRVKPTLDSTNATLNQSPIAPAHATQQTRHLSYTELEARAEELQGQFYAVFDCSGRIDSALLLSLLGYYGHFVGVVGRVDSNPLPAFETCISLHEIALGAIHTHGSAQDFTTLQAQATRLFALLDNPRFLQCLPPLEIIPFTQIPTALESLKAQNLGVKFVALL